MVGALRVSKKGIQNMIEVSHSEFTKNLIALLPFYFFSVTNELNLFF